MPVLVSYQCCLPITLSCTTQRSSKKKYFFLNIYIPLCIKLYRMNKQMTVKHNRILIEAETCSCIDIINILSCSCSTVICLFLLHEKYSRAVQVIFDASCPKSEGSCKPAVQMQHACSAVVAKAAGMRHPETLMEIHAVTLKQM